MKIGQTIHPQATLPPLQADGSIQPFPEAILARRLVKRGNAADVEVLVK